MNGVVIVFFTLTVRFGKSVRTTVSLNITKPALTFGRQDRYLASERVQRDWTILVAALAATSGLRQRSSLGLRFSFDGRPRAALHFAHRSPCFVKNLSKPFRAKRSWRNLAASRWCFSIEQRAAAAV